MQGHDCKVWPFPTPLTYLQATALVIPLPTIRSARASFTCDSVCLGTLLA